MVGVAREQFITTVPPWPPTNGPPLPTMVFCVELSWPQSLWHSLAKLLRCVHIDEPPFTEIVLEPPLKREEDREGLQEEEEEGERGEVGLTHVCSSHLGLSSFF